jgi:hypothetical protein
VHFYGDTGGVFAPAMETLQQLLVLADQATSAAVLAVEKGFENRGYVATLQRELLPIYIQQNAVLPTPPLLTVYHSEGYCVIVYSCQKKAIEMRFHSPSGRRTAPREEQPVNQTLPYSGIGFSETNETLYDVMRSVLDDVMLQHKNTPNLVNIFFLRYIV